MSAAEYLHSLGKALTAEGLTVATDEKRWTLTARNVAAEPDQPHPLAKAYGNTSLTQRVVLAKNQGQPYWFWEWSGPTRGSAPEYEPIAPASEVATVAGRIIRVLALAGA